MTMDEIRQALSFSDKVMATPELAESTGALKILVEGYRKMILELMVMIEIKEEAQ